MLAPWKKSYDKPRQCIKRQRYHFANEGLYSQSYGFSISGMECRPFLHDHVEMWEIDCKGSGALKNNAFELWFWKRLLRIPWTVRRSSQSILKEVNPEFIRRSVVEADIPILWPPNAKSWLIGKDPDAGKDWRQKEKAKQSRPVMSDSLWPHGL